jgi:hypothetical protein
MTVKVPDLAKAEVALRTAAKAWGDGLSAPVVGSHDLASLRLDRKLQRAAVAYVAALAQDSGIPQGWRQILTRLAEDMRSTVGLNYTTVKEWAEVLESMTGVAKAVYRCQFCEKESSVQEWKNDKCPKCGKTYDPMLAQEGDD